MEAVMTAGMAREGGEWRRDRKGVARAIRRLVDRLKHRREVWCTVSEADCKRVVVDKDEETEEAVKQAEQVPDAGRRPGEELAEWERIHQFEAYLEPDREAQELVECYCGNVSSPREIARLTGLTCREVKNARERVQAKWKRFRRMECKAKVRIPYPEEASHVGQNQARFEVTTY
jgi:DNA polymerase III epsilon subunit-like protein